MKWLGLLIATAVLLSAGAATATGTSAAKAHRCPPTSKTASLPRRAGKAMYADVDGDGIRDRITMRTAHYVNCRFFLVVQTQSRAYAIGAPRVCRDGCPYPLVAMAVRLGDGRSQIVVNRWEGASNTGVAFYEVIRGKLRSIHISKRDGSVLSLFGFARADTEATCGRAGPLRVFGFWTAGSGPRANFDRTVYHLRNGRFVRVAYRRTPHPLGARHKPPSSPSWYRKTSFARCLVAGSSRRLSVR